MSGTEVRFCCPFCCKDDPKKRVKAEILEINVDHTGKMYLDIVCSRCGKNPKIQSKPSPQTLLKLPPLTMNEPKLEPRVI